MRCRSTSLERKQPVVTRYITIWPWPFAIICHVIDRCYGIRIIWVTFSNHIRQGNDESTSPLFNIMGNAYQSDIRSRWGRRNWLRFRGTPLGHTHGLGTLPQHLRPDWKQINKYILFNSSYYKNCAIWGATMSLIRNVNNAYIPIIPNFKGN